MIPEWNIDYRRVSSQATRNYKFSTSAVCHPFPEGMDGTHHIHTHDMEDHLINSK